MLWHDCRTLMPDLPMILLWPLQILRLAPKFPICQRLPMQLLVWLVSKEIFYLAFSLAALTVLSAPQIRAVLCELGQAVPANQPGGVGLLRRQLRAQMGLRAEHAQVA